MTYIFLPQTKAALRAWWRQAHDCYGDNYDKFVAPYRSILVMYCRKNKDKDPVLAAKELIGLVIGKWIADHGQDLPADRTQHYKACLYAGAYDVIEQNLIENSPAPQERTIITPDDSDFLDGINGAPPQE